MRLIKKYSYLLFLICIPIVLEAQVSFTAAANAKQVILGNDFDITFTLKNAKGTDLQAPSFKGFRVLSGPSQSTSMSIINGRRSQEMAISYTLQPEKIGKLKIQPATILVNGQKITSNVVNIEVLKGKKGASSQAQLDKDFSKQVFVKIIPNTTNARIGQQVVLDYKIYTTLNIEQFNLMTESDYQGFYPHEMRQYPNSLVKEVVDGVQYTTKILRRMALFPQQAGKLSIEAAQVQVGIPTGTAPKRRSIFYRPQLKRHNILTNAVEINVQPLPNNAPPSFTGAVGKYQISLDIDRANVTTDDAVVIKMSIQGNGDVKQVQAPPLLLNDTSFEVYDPRIVNEKTFESQAILYSNKEVEYLVLPKQAGAYKITPTFTYFDTDSLKYISLQPRTFSIHVKKGTNKKSSVLPTVEEQTINEDIRFIKTSTSLSQKGSPFFDSLFYYMLWGLPMVLFGGFFVYHRNQANKEAIDPLVLKRNRAKKLAQERLSKAETHLKANTSKAFYDEVSRGMLGYVCDKLNIQTSELTKHNVREKLTGLNVHTASIDKFMDIIKNCEIALFAGMDNSAAMQSTYDNTIDVVASIEEEIGD